MKAADDELLAPDHSEDWGGVRAVPASLLPYTAAAVRQFAGSALVVEQLQSGEVAEPPALVWRIIVLDRDDGKQKLAEQAVADDKDT